MTTSTESAQVREMPNGQGYWPWLPLIAIGGFGLYAALDPVRVLLWTDALIYLLVAVILAAIMHTLRFEHLRAPWRQVGRSRLGMASAIILAVYVGIGLLDSVHFHPQLDTPPGQSVAEPGAAIQYSTEVLSLFDVLVNHLRTRDEKTYSAPFATTLYAKETVESTDGRKIRSYPPLKYAGTHLASPEDRNADIIATIVRASADALLMFAVLCAVVVAGLCRATRRSPLQVLAGVWRADFDAPWRVMLVTTGLVILLATVAWQLSVDYHIFGTDKVGQDVFYQALKSIRTGLVIGTLTTLIMLPFAILLGIMAGYFRGWIDDVIQYIYTTLNSIPGVLLIAASILMMQVYISGHADQFESLEQRADLRLLFLCVILGITSWTGLCRLLRGETLKLREVEYIQAASAFGVKGTTILRRHILPNVMHIVLISIVLDFSGLVLAEAVLSYINIGVDPSTISWGNMINSARLELAREPVVWWSLAAAFTFMFTLVLAANLFADAIRDAFDPRLRTQR